MKKNLIHIMYISAVLAQTPDVLLQNGLELMNNNNLDSAQTVMEKALQADPTFAPVMIALSQVYLRRGDMEKTEEYIRNAIDTDPENQEYRDEFELLNEINTLMADGLRTMQNGDLAGSYESYRIVFEKFPFFPDAPYSMGLVKFREKDFEAAIGHFKQALKLYPLHENARTAINNVAKNKFNEGNNSYRRRDLEGALVAYEDVLKIDELFFQAHYQIGVIQAKMGDRSSAIDHYKKALEISPQFYKGYYALALSQKANGNLDGAIQSLQSAVDIHPGYDKAFGAIGDIYFEQKNYDKAVEALNRSIQVNPQYAKGYLSLGIIYSEQELFELALPNLEMATSLNNKNNMAWYRLAVAYNAQGDCENAKRAALVCTDLKKGFGGGWLELGVAEWCTGRGNKRAAENALEKARNDRTWRKSAEYELDKVRNPEKYLK